MAKRPRLLGCRTRTPGRRALSVLARREVSAARLAGGLARAGARPGTHRRGARGGANGWARSTTSGPPACARLGPGGEGSAWPAGHAGTAGRRRATLRRWWRTVRPARQSRPPAGTSAPRPAGSCRLARAPHRPDGAGAAGPLPPRPGIRPGDRPAAAPRVGRDGGARVGCSTLSMRLAPAPPPHRPRLPARLWPVLRKRGLRRARLRQRGQHQPQARRRGAGEQPVRGGGEVLRVREDQVPLPRGGEAGRAPAVRRLLPARAVDRGRRSLHRLRQAAPHPPQGGLRGLPCGAGALPGHARRLVPDPLLQREGPDPGPGRLHRAQRVREDCTPTRSTCRRRRRTWPRSGSGSPSTRSTSPTSTRSATAGRRRSTGWRRWPTSTPATTTSGCSSASTTSTSG